MIPAGIIAAISSVAAARMFQPLTVEMVASERQ
jgi:hypothetical protein